MRKRLRRRASGLGPLLAAAVCGPLALPGAAAADSLPLPAADFTLKADLRFGGTMEIAHSQGRMRIEITRPNLPSSIIGIIDLKARKMVTRSPTVPSMAVEIELPPEYVLGALTGSGLRVGEGKVAGEACDLWRIEPQVGASVGPTTACITPDGIALRTEVEIQGRKQTVFEATQLSRAPQDARLFQLPAGVQVVKVPKGKIGTALGLPGFGAPPPAAGAAPASPPAPKP